MANLNVSLIVRYTDRMSAPASLATRTLAVFGAAQRQVGMASKLAGAAADGTAKATSGLARIAELATNSTTELTSSQKELGARIDTNRRSFQAAASRLSSFERMQWRGRAATRMLGNEVDRLNDKIGKLAMASIATSGMERAGRGIVGPMMAAVNRAAEFQKGMTGIGILADLSDRQLGPVRTNIIASAQRLAIPIETMQQDDMAVLNEAVYRKGADLIRASQSAAKLSLLADIGGAPITGAQAGGLMATYAHSMLMPPSMLDRLNATVFRASQIGGNKIGDAARFLPEIMGQMKARAFGNFQGFVDANAALQLTKRVTGDDEAAGTDVRDLMQNLNHMLTDRRFAKAGMNLEKIIANGVKHNVSPLTSSLNAIMARVGSSATDPGLAGKLGKFFQNAQAATAATAIITNQRDTSAGPGFDSFRRQIADPSALTAYNSAVKRASQGPYADLVRLANARKQIAIATGTILFPALNKVAGAMTRIANLVTRFETHGGLLAKTAIYAASGVGVLALGAGALGNALVGIIGPIWIARSLFGPVIPLVTRIAGGELAGLATRFGFAAGGARLFNGGLIGLATRGLPAAAMALRGFAVAALANPATWPIVAGVVAVAATALVIRKYWQPITAFFRGVWDGIAQGLHPIVPMVTRTAQTISTAFKPVVPIWHAVADAAGAAWKWFGKLIEPVKMTGRELRNTTDAGRRFGLAIVGVERFALSALNPLTFARMGGQLMQGLIKGLLSMGPAVQRAVALMGDRVARWFKDRLGIRSPSTVFARLGDHTLAGYALGLQRSATLPLASLARLTAAMTAAASLSLPAASAMAASEAAGAPPAHVLDHIRSTATPAKGAVDPRREPRREPANVHVTNTFHIHQGTDARALAAQLSRLQEAALRRACFDGND